ncbi:hypothetical protein [Acidiphilium rubrum]|uniref:hypothetical protein n=1 Tax=Acidiphilium rubrum TaxID=526 RepID=UPI002D1FA7F4|nr:hypothetical protein [Acidiphilium rubrum]
MTPFNEGSLSALGIHGAGKVMTRQPETVTGILDVDGKNLSLFGLEQPAIDREQLAFVFDAVFGFWSRRLFDIGHRMVFTSARNVTCCSRRLANRAYVRRITSHILQLWAVVSNCRNQNKLNGLKSWEWFARIAANAHDSNRESQMLRGATYDKNQQRRAMILA